MKMKTKYFFVLMVAVLMGTQVMNAQNETNKRTDKRMRPRMTMEQLASAVATANKKVASYKWVTHFAMTTEDLPLTSTQKVKHHVVRQNLINGMYPDRHE